MSFTSSLARFRCWVSGHRPGAALFRRSQGSRTESQSPLTRPPVEYELVGRECDRCATIDRRLAALESDVKRLEGRP